MKKRQRKKGRNENKIDDLRLGIAGLENYYVYKGKPRHKLPCDTSLPDELNAFYARVEGSNIEA
jgi:hypothetical protein